MAEGARLKQLRGETVFRPEKMLFGQGVRLGLLYSGNLGKAHDYELFLKLARKVREEFYY